MSYGYPGPGDEQQPAPPQPGQQPAQEWQQPGQEWQQPGPGWQQPPPPPGWQQPGPGWGGPPQPPQPPHKSNTGLIVGLTIAGAVIVLVVLGVIGVMAVSDDSSKDGGSAARSTASEQSTAEEGDAKESPAEESAAEESAAEEPAEESGAEGDVKITGCEVDSLTTWASAEVLITNRTSKKADYIINVEFVNSSGKRLGEALAAVNSLAPGQKSEETAQGLDTIKGKIECKVTEVTRYLS
ncbi:FxLYD domain-containing protein [Streptomyces sp. NPDC050997]|uniref:FxLYD domain-containing protein n=1 Tax=Streptomyces sp. NPDC050997 TaxID=3155519 RepID=UPI0034146594